MPDPAPWFDAAQAFLGALYSCVRRERLFPQWPVQARATVHTAATAMLDQVARVEFAIGAAGVRLNGTAVDPARAGQVVWDGAAMLGERLIRSLALERGVSLRELASFAGALASPADSARMRPDEWEHFLKTEGVSHLAIVQRPYAAPSEESETVILQRGELRGAPLDPFGVAEVRHVARALVEAASAVRARGPDDRATEERVADAVDRLQEFLRQYRVLALAPSETGLVVNTTSVPEKDGDDAPRRLAAEMASKSMAELTLKDGLTLDEATALVSLLAIDPAARDASKHAETILGGNGIRRFVVRRTVAGPAMPAPRPRPAPEPPKPETKRRVPVDALADEFLRKPLGAIAEAGVQAMVVRLVQELPPDRASQVLARLAAATGEFAPALRGAALTLVRRALRELKGPALELFIGRTTGVMIERLESEQDAVVHALLAETLQLWLTVAILAKQTAHAAEVLRRGVEGLSPAVRSSLAPKLRMVGQLAGAAAFDVFARGSAEAKEHARTVLKWVGAALAPKLRALSGDREPETARAASEALSLIGRTS
jgi:hypothetical protein